MDKPDCFKCKHRDKVPGSAHSRCNHPSTKEVTKNNPMLEMLGVFASVGRVLPIQLDTGLNVKGDSYGTSQGWFNWPFNFDPLWLENCDGFENKED